MRARPTRSLRAGRTRSDVLLGLVTANLLWAYVAYGQRHPSPLGPYLESTVESAPSSVVVLASPAGTPAQIVMSFAEQAILETYALTPSGRLPLNAATRTGFPAAMMLAADMNGNGTEELLLLSASGSEFSVLQRRGNEEREELHRLDFRAQRMVAADINNDGFKDVLLFGRHMAGIQVLAGTRRSGLVHGPLLFPEFSVSDLVATDLNGDRITDIVLLNWLSERLQVHFGIGKDMFSEQVSLQLPGEPGRLSMITVGQRRMIRVVVTLPDQFAVAHVVGSPAGDFALRELIPVQGRPLHVGITLLNEDALPDLLCTTSEGMIVGLGQTASTFGPGVMYGVGAGAAALSAADVDGNGLRDLVIADRQRRRLVVIGNAAGTSRVAWPPEYIAGVAPSGVDIADWNKDGLPDLLVANRGSSSVGLFFGAEDGRLGGMRALSVPEKPATVRLVGGQAQTGRTVVTVHPSSEQLGIMRLPPANGVTGTLAVPTGPRPLLLALESDPITGRLSILLRYRYANGSRPPLALFEEISSRQVLERSFQFTFPTSVTAMAAGDFTGNGRTDVVLAVRDRMSRTSTISLAPAASGYDFGPIQTLLTIPDSTSPVRMLAAARLSGTSRSDLLLFFGAPHYSMAIAHAGADSTPLVLSPVRITGVRPADELAVVCDDVDGDGLTDIVYLAENTDAVYCMFGSRSGRVEEPRIVLRAEGAKRFAVGRLRGRTSADLILTHESRHTVSVSSGVFDR